MYFRIDFDTCEPVSALGDSGHACAVQETPAIAGLAAGFAAGTDIATPDGWRSVEDLVPGDRVLTFDHGSRAVRSVRRGRLWRGGRMCPRPLWPLWVPKGALGNTTPLTLLPEQSVLVESDLAEALFGDPFVLLPAHMLDGLWGIHRLPPERPVEVIVPLFDRPEVAFANGAALMFCPALGKGGTIPLDQLDMLDHVSEPLYKQPEPEVARRLVAALWAEQEGASASPFLSYAA